MANKMLASETWSVTPTGTPDSRVFESSKELFINLRRSFKRATPLHNSQVLLDLQRAVSTTVLAGVQEMSFARLGWVAARVFALVHIVRPARGPGEGCHAIYNSETRITDEQV